jgi:hypothetical protein
MSFGDFLQLPPGARTLFAVMLWPAVWAAAAMVVALVTDILRGMKRPDTLRRPAKDVGLRQ